MPEEDDSKTPAPDAVANVILAPVLAAAPVTAPAIADPQVLIDAFRYLQERIPGFTHLTIQEKRSHTRAANLDPEFIESGLQAAAVWSRTKALTGRSAEELRQELEEIRHYDEFIAELRALTDGSESANLKRKHRLGHAILQIYQILGLELRRPFAGDVQMRPYYENMKRAYQRTQRFRKGKKKDETSTAPPATDTD